MSKINVRFAPSPTGHLHVGNGRVALINWLFAKKEIGNFILRHDDTDSDRSGDKFIDLIEQSLSWLGISWDLKVRQSERLDLYKAAITKLKDSGRLYPCYELPEELSLKRKAQLSAGKPPIYDRSSLSLSNSDRSAFSKDGRKPHWRFLLDSKPSSWSDLIHGDMLLDPLTMSDPILVREDDSPLYTLTSIVDDADLNISHVIRGDDHLSNTAIQIQLFEALDSQVPIFAHLALLVGSKGEGLSKRLGSLGLESFRKEGIEPHAITGLLAKLGSSQPVNPIRKLKELVPTFNISHFSKSTAKFDTESLSLLNTRILQNTDYEDISERLDDSLPRAIAKEFWETIRPNINFFHDTKEWMSIVFGSIQPNPSNVPEFLTVALNLLPSDPWDEKTWEDWTNAISSATGEKGKKLFQPLRIAITGKSHGPVMKRLLPLVGRDRVKERLKS